MKLKYGKWMKRFGAVAFALTVASSCIVGGTLAKYTTTVAGTGSAIVAKWAPSFKGKTGGASGTFNDSVDVELKDTTLGNKVTDGKIAPGTDGSFSIQISPGATDVMFKYSITLSNFTNQPKNLKFYSDSTFTTELTEKSAGSGIYELYKDEEMALNGADVTKTIYWQWPYNVSTESSSEAESRDAEDSDTGNKATVSNADKMTFKVNCEAIQMGPTPTS